MADFNLKNYIAFWAERVDRFFESYLEPHDIHTAGLIKSMKYSLNAGGKRMRPAVIYSSFGIFDSYFDKVTPYAAAVEILHTYSLIHDDLPAMDNDDFRRGKPTNHKVFGEAGAILAGDALLTKSFEIMLNKKINPDIEDALMAEAAFKLAVAAGDRGMVGGQYADMQAEKTTPEEATVDFIHLHKTASLISYCSELGAILGYGSDKDKENMKTYGERIGLAFQIVDDVLDVTSTAEELGKTIGKDSAGGKATYAALYGVEKSMQIAREVTDSAIAAVEGYGKSAAPCIAIAEYVFERKN